jgi:pseudo-rSAM protein
MAHDIDFSKPYWFYISPDVYVLYNGDETVMLLYHTKTGKYLEIDHPSCIQLIKDVYKPKNLGVVKMFLSEAKDLQLISHIKAIIEHKMGGIIEERKDLKKPINLLPFLSLSKDVDKLQKDEDISLIVNDLISYLSELNLYLNGECPNNCSLCSSYYKQFKSCVVLEDKQELSPDTLQMVFEQIKYSRVRVVNLLGGNLLQYPHLKELPKTLKKYDFECHIWVNYLNLPEEILSIFKNKKIHKEILITFPLQKNEAEDVIRKYQQIQNIKFHFFIEDEIQYIIVKELIDNFDLENVNIVPIYTEKNKSFFTDNIFLEKEDIFSSIIDMRQIFRNQKLNSNDFGSLTILPNGDVRANVNREKLGNVCESSILELLYKELIENTAWRKIRNEGVCKGCLYQFLCPPPSNYEVAIGKPNLCHI